MHCALLQHHKKLCKSLSNVLGGGGVFEQHKATSQSSSMTIEKVYNDVSNGYVATGL